MHHHHPINPVSRNGLPILFMAVFCWLVFFTWAVMAEEPTPSPTSSRLGLSDSSLPKAVNLWLESPETARDLWGPISTWNTEHVTNLDNLFQGAKEFNEDLSQWNTQQVTSMQYTFADCRQFNQPLQNWTVDKVVTLQGVFSGADSFNQNLDQWNTSRVTDMSGAFKGATFFNGKLSGWNTSAVKSMEWMFYGASFFQDKSQSLPNWDVTSVTSMQSMFSGATSFNGKLTDWQPRYVSNFMGMFAYTASFDQDISKWDMRSAKYMDRMFYKAVAFEQELCWDDSFTTFDVSGMEFFCGSAGEFTMDCRNIPKGAEDYCPETYQEFEEDEELLDSLLPPYEPDVPFGQESDASTNNSSSSGYGGSGGVGALNPGGVAVGRDQPHSTANLEEWERDNPSDRTEGTSAGGTINVGISNTNNNDEQGYFSGSSYPESVVMAVQRDDSAAPSIMTRRMGLSTIISTVATLFVTSSGLC